MAIINKALKAKPAGPIDATGTVIPGSAPVAMGPVMILELAQLSRYVLGSTLYEKGVAYKFTENQAKEMLRRSLPDTGLPIWKMYSPPKPKVKLNEHGSPTMDMTRNDLPKYDGGPVAIEAGNINIGDDSELEGILPAGGETEIEV